MLGKNYGMLEKVSRVARCISKLAYKVHETIRYETNFTPL
jgi:hypothetical protein